MRSTRSKQSKWRNPTTFLAVLIGAAALITPLASGCGPNDIISYTCPDAGADGGDAGDGGAGGSNPLCK
jgi:hypothetical protein